MNITKKILQVVLWVAVLGAVVFIGHAILKGGIIKDNVRGGANGAETTDPNGNLSSNFTYSENSSAFMTDQYFSIGSSTPNGVSPTAIGGSFNKTEVITAGTCATASSTLFSIKNPLNATSSVSVTITGIGQASSSNLTIGTSSPLLSSGYKQNDLSGSLVYNLGVAIATTSQFYIRSGQITGLGTGQAPAGTSTAAVVSSILVGPTENLGAFSTSTYPIGGGAVGGIGNYVPGQTCTYKADWVQ